MKPDWDKLMEQYQDNAGVLVGDVDCTGAGKPLCEKNGVGGYPTIKYGDPDALQEYPGGRSLEQVQEFAATLGPRAPKTPVEQLMIKLNKILGPLKEDIDHIIDVRKNAAVFLVVAGLLLGLVLGRCTAHGSKSSNRKEKKDA